ncbi:hypothetical protein DFH06DRAFT_1344225 [Mycena polygramma]|nr:hypothetical protein DFH06DRAFT_1344225 [Mycena polygramma]
MSSSSTELGTLAASSINTLQGELITTAIQFFLHGFYTTLVGIALYNMWTHNPVLKARRALIVATLFMFACSNIQVIEQLAFNIIQVVTLGLNPPNNSKLLLNIRLSENVFGRVNYFMSDAIVVWRAWVLWPDNSRVKTLLSLCMFGSFVGTATDMTFTALFFCGNNKFTPTGPRTLILTVPLMVTNIVSTALIGIKVWHYRTQIKSLLGLPKNKRTNIERILVMLTESGTIYCLIWVPQLFVALTSTSVDNTGYKITANIIPQLSAIYPVIIVLLVAMEKTHLETTTMGPASQPINFGSVPDTAASTGTIRFNDPECSRIELGGIDEKGTPDAQAASYVVTVPEGESR